MPVSRLYHTWSDRIRQLYPQGGKALIQNHTWLLTCTCLNREYHLSEITDEIPGCAK